MGQKDLMVYIKKEGGNKQAYCCDPSDTIVEVKENILTKAYYTNPKKKFLVKAERDKVDLTLNDQALTEGKTLGDFQIKAGDVLKYTFKAPLAGE